MAGNGTGSYGGDNGPATSAQLNAPYSVAVDSSGNLYIADKENNRIRKISNGAITTVAGNGPNSYGGDNGPATSAQLNGPYGVALDASGNLYIADYHNNRIRKVSNGVITTVAGNGTLGYSGDNGPATSAQLDDPTGIAVDAAGNLYIADTDNHRIRKVSNGVISTVAGSGRAGYSGDNGPATSARLWSPQGIAVDTAGNLYIADTGNSRIREVSNGVISTMAGGDSIGLAYPYGVALDVAGNLYIGDTNNNCVRKVSNGVMTTIAGDGMPSFGGDNGPAISAELFFPHGVAVDATGKVYIADMINNRVRILTPTGPSCTYSVSPTTLQAPSAGGNLTVSIQTAAASCLWTISGVPSWITVSGPSSNAGSVNVTLVIAPNNSDVTLSATVLIAGVSIPVTQVAAVPLPTIKGVTNAASFQAGPISPGEIVTIGGTGLGPSIPAALTLDQNGKVSTVVGGVQVLFSGFPAPLTYVSSTQINCVVPYEIQGLLSPYVQVKYLGQSSNSISLTSIPTVPALFTFNGSGVGPGASLNQDYTYNAPNNPALKGSYIVLYITGEGQTAPTGVTGRVTTISTTPPLTPQPLLPVAVLIAGQPAFVAFYGAAPGLVSGVMQLNVQIPVNVPSGNLSIAVSVGGNSSQNGVTVSVQ